MRFETVEGLGWTNEAKEALQRIKRKLKKLQTLAILKEGEVMMLCLWKRSEMISSLLLVEREGIQIPVSYFKVVTDGPMEEIRKLSGREGRLAKWAAEVRMMSFEELSQKFLEEFSQQKRYAKDPIEIHGIKRRHNKGLQAFIDRFISESSHIKGVPLVLRISAFMHGHGHPELAKKLNDKIPKTVDEMFERVRAFIRGEVAAGSTEMVRPSQGDKGGHNTNDYYQLKKQIEEVVASGKLAHMVKDIRRNNQRSQKSEDAEFRCQIRMTEDDKEKTGFHTEEGVYCFTHMPEELKNSTATLQRMMEKVLVDQKGRNVEIYLEEIVIKRKSELDLVQDVEETLRKLKTVNIKIDPVTSSFEIKKGRFLGYMVTKEGVRADPEKMNEAKEALQMIKRKLNKLQTLAVPKEGEILMLCLRQKDETINYVLLVEREGIQILVSYAKSTPTPRAWMLYLGKQTIEEGLGVGIILVSPEERMHSYVTRLKSNISDHAIDCEALLAGLAASIRKHMKDLHVFMDLPNLVAHTEGNHMLATKQERKYKKEIMDATSPFYRKYQWVSKKDHRWKRQAAAKKEKQQAIYQVQSQTTIGKLVE
ncbi:hypothetical protein Tco_0303813 [Tanacetum coccineum]